MSEYLDFDTALRAYVVENTGVNGRIYPQKLPERVVLPAATYQRITLTAIQTHGAPPDMLRPRIQFTCWSLEFAEARELAAEIEAALAGFRGTIGPQGNQYRVESSLFADSRDFNDPETGLWYRQLDFHILYKGDQ